MNPSSTIRRASQGRGYQSKFRHGEHGEPAFNLSANVDGFIRDRPFQGQHMRFVDDDDEDDDNDRKREERKGHGMSSSKDRTKDRDNDGNNSKSKGTSRSRSQERAEVKRTTFLTTTNRLPPNHHHKERHEDENKNRIKNKDERSATHMERPLNKSLITKPIPTPILTTVNRPHQGHSQENKHLHQTPERHKQKQQQWSQSSPERKKHFTSSPSSTPQNHPPKSLSISSPATPRRKGVVIEKPTLTLEDLAPPPPFPSPSPVSPRSATSPRTGKKVPRLKRIVSVESVESMPELPETEEEYDLLDYKTKMRLGDEIQVRNKIRAMEQGIGFSSSQDSGKRDRRHRSDSAGEDERHHDRKQDGKEKNHRHIDEIKKGTKQGVETNANDQTQEDMNDDNHKDGDKSKTKDRDTEGEEEEEMSQGRPVYHAQHTNFQQNDPSDSDSGLDMDPFKAKPLGLPKKDSSATTSSSSSSKNRNVPPEGHEILTVNESDSSSSEDSRSDREDAAISKGRGVDDIHQRTADRKSIPKKATAIHNSKPWKVTDEEREKYKHLFVERPVLTHTTTTASTSSNNVVVSEKPVESKEEAISKTRIAKPKATGESKWKAEDKRKKDFFNLSQQEAMADSFKGRSKASTERRRTSPIPSPDLGRKRVQKSEHPAKNKSTSKTQRFIKSNQSLRSRDESSSPLRETQRDMDPKVYDLVTPSPRALSEAERDIKGSSAKSPSKKRSKPQLSDISSDDDDDFFQEDSSARRSVRSPHRTSTKIIPTSNGRSALQGSPPHWTPRSGETFQLPSPTRKRPRQSSPGDLTFLSDEDDIPNIALEDDIASGKICPYCGDPLPEVMTKRLRTSLTKILANLKELQQQQRQRERRRSADNYVDLTVDKDEEHRRRIREPTMMEKFEFCRIHVAEEKIVPVGIDRNYPLHINFLDLPRRVENMQAELKGIVEKSVPSFYLNRALDNYKRMGTFGARNPHVIIANVEQTMPGYYGSKGAAILSHTLAKLFLETNILTRELALPQLPTEYVQHVLVPEAGLRLIVEDRIAFTGNDQLPISLDEAREIMMDSVEFGNYIHDVELNT